MKIHFIGIGGIGMSALAQYYLSKGQEVFGSDLASSEITDFLKEKGIGVAIGNYSQNIKEDFNLVVYSPAVPKDNPEYKRAVELGIKLQSYPEALGELTKQYFTIAVSGSHGKSTTTAMIGLILAKAGLDPTVIVGTKLKEFGDSNFREGKSSFLVIEACEYDDSFANYQPKIVAVTNIDKEHLDYFKTFGNIVKAFKKFILKLPQDGFLVSNKDDKNLFKISKGKFKTEYYSIKSRSQSDRGSSILSGQKEAAKLKKNLKIPGSHNVSNALAALSVARILNVKDATSLKTLSEYKGSWRRFEVFDKKLTSPKNLKTINYTLISDYGHHPNEISATLKSAREKYPKKIMWCIFQPHQYQRTYYLLKDFVKVFREAPIDNIIITDIYDVAGREDKKISSNVSSKNLVEKVKKNSVSYFSVDEAEKYVKENIKSGEALIVMGAGDIYKLVDKL